MQDEQCLVKKAQQHDNKAFSQLYETYFDKIYRYIMLKIGNRTEAEDMTQQVFLKAFKSLPAYKYQEVPFSAWLYRIAHNQMVDYFRKSSRQQSCELIEEVSQADTGDNPQHHVELKMDIESLVDATRHLTTLQREVLALRFTSDLPVAEVARIMGKSEGAIKALQHSAVVALRKIMAADGYV